MDAAAATAVRAYSCVCARESVTAAAARLEGRIQTGCPLFAAHCSLLAAAAALQSRRHRKQNGILCACHLAWQSSRAQAAERDNCCAHCVSSQRRPLCVGVHDECAHVCVCAFVCECASLCAVFVVVAAAVTVVIVVVAATAAVRCLD